MRQHFHICLISFFMLKQHIKTPDIQTDYFPYNISQTADTIPNKKQKILFRWLCHKLAVFRSNPIYRQHI